MTKSTDRRSPTGSGVEVRVLGRRYRLLEKVGEGAASEVYRADDQRLRRQVAVKIPRTQLTADRAFRRRFSAEARAAATLSHPNVVSVYDMGGAPQGGLYIAMEFVDGRTLADLLAERRRLDPSEAIDIVRQVCAGLQAAHDHGLIHRDVKPGNILIGRDGIVRLADFGIAKMLDATSAMTQPGTVFGTASYLAPEQALGAPVGPATDIYAVGVVLFEMLVGERPFSGESPTGVAFQHVHAAPPRLSERVADVHPLLEEIVRRCLEKEPVDRYPSASDLAAHLDQARAAVTGPVAPEVRPATAATAAAVPVDQDAVTQRFGAFGAVAEGAQPLDAARTGGRPRSAWMDPARARPAVLAAVGGVLLVVFAGASLLSGAIRPGAVPGAAALDASAAVRPDVKDAGVAPSPALGETGTDPAAPRPAARSRSRVAPPAANGPVDPLGARGPAGMRTEPARPPGRVPPSATVADPDVVAGGRSGVTIGPDRFSGIRGVDRYRGRTVVRVFGSGTPYGVATVSFDVPRHGRRASIVLVGSDGPDRSRPRIAISVNDHHLYRGLDKLPSRGRGTHRIRFPGHWLRRGVNTLRIANISDSSCTACPRYVAVDRVLIRY